MGANQGGRRGERIRPGSTGERTQRRGRCATLSVEKMNPRKAAIIEVEGDDGIERPIGL